MVAAFGQNSLKTGLAQPDQPVLKGKKCHPRQIAATGLELDLIADTLNGAGAQIQ